ncbi:hypothetical protein AB0J21_02985 [Streptomyces sp. NPDC049954]|uniref:hypothetical protein n=1 Tax=Streptomyces sp. NPDC049954 TaxID=3155779 RepID=UPI00341D8A72
MQHWFVPPLLALAGPGAVGSFQFVPRQNRVFVAGGDQASVALSLNGSTDCVGTAVGAGLGGVVLSGSDATLIAPALVALAAVVPVLAWLTAPGRRAGPWPGAQTIRGEEPQPSGGWTAANREAAAPHRARTTDAGGLRGRLAPRDQVRQAGRGVGRGLSLRASICAYRRARPGL